MNFERNFNQPKEPVEKKEEPIYKTIHGVKYEVIGSQKKLAPQSKPEPEISRRRFLKAALGLGGAAIAGSAAVKSLEMASKFGKKIFDEQPPDKKSKEEEIKLEPTEEQTEIEKEDFITTAEILDFNKPDKIEFNLETVERIKNGWKKKYIKNPKLRDGFTRAYREMGYWQPYLEDIFEQQRIPKEYIFLAIPESHWQPAAISRTGATGPYQFMSATAKPYGLRMEPGFDERKDPLASASACAKLLSHLYRRTHDWNLALSGYNGGFLWKYLKGIGPDTRPSYPEYLKFVEDILNDKKTKIKNLAMPEALKKKLYDKKIRGYSENINYPAKFYAIKELIDEKFVTEQEASVKFQEVEFAQSKPKYNFYKIAKGDTVSGIARRFGARPANIAALNPQIKRGLKIGQEIKLPSGRTHALSLRDVANQTESSLERLAFLNPAIKIDAPLPKTRIRI